MKAHSKSLKKSFFVTDSSLWVMNWTNDYMAIAIATTNMRRVDISVLNLRHLLKIHKWYISLCLIRQSTSRYVFSTFASGSYLVRYVMINTNFNKCLSKCFPGTTCRLIYQFRMLSKWFNIQFFPLDWYKWSTSLSSTTGDI